MPTRDGQSERPLEPWRCALCELPLTAHHTLDHPATPPTEESLRRRFVEGYVDVFTFERLIGAVLNA